MFDARPPTSVYKENSNRDDLDATITLLNHTAQLTKGKVGNVNSEINVSSVQKHTTWNGSQAYFKCSPWQVNSFPPATCLG